MVCNLDPVRMAAMVRLLSSGSHLEVSAEEATHEKIAVQTINREFREANEANLLEEKDMHIFDSRPLTDPLYLVRCNACRKPIKASQYAIHAERCRALNSSQEISMEPDAGAGNKKPPKKGRKKLQNGRSNQGMTTGEQEKSDSMDGDIVASSELNSDEQYGMFSRPSRDGKSTFTSADHTTKMGSSGASPGSTNHKAGVDSPYEYVEPYIHFTAGAPAPLATKMYYAQGSHRLRAAIGHLYHHSVANGIGSDPTPILVQDTVMVSSNVAPPGKLLHSMQKDNAAHQKNDTCPGYTTRNPDQILAQSSESYLGASGEYASVMSFSNQLSGSNLPKSGSTADNAAVGTMRMRYHSSSHTFPGNPGAAALGTMQKQNGSVPVV